MRCCSVRAHVLRIWGQCVETSEWMRERLVMLDLMIRVAHQSVLWYLEQIAGMLIGQASGCVQCVRTNILYPTTATLCAASGIQTDSVVT